MTKLVINTKSFKSVPAQHRAINLDLYVQDPDWITKLVRLCPPITRAQLDKHIGVGSHYELKHMLLHSLKFHYAVLSGALNDVDLHSICLTIKKQH